MRERLTAFCPLLPIRFRFLHFTLWACPFSRNIGTRQVSNGLSVASDAERQHLLRETLGVSARRTRSLLSAISVAKRTGQAPAEAEQATVYSRYQQEIRRGGTWSISRT